MNERAEALGKLVTNMQSLEFALRSFLLNAEIAKGQHFPKIDFTTLRQGDVVPLNAFTNYDSLSMLILKYNNDPRVVSAGLVIDDTLVHLRDALAHGRISSPHPSEETYLIKFKKPDGNKVEVEYSEQMTEDWFTEQRKRSYDAVMKVLDANERLGDGRL